MELEAESVLTKKNGIVRLSEMLYPIDGYRKIREDAKRKVIEIVMNDKKNVYPNEAIEILGGPMSEGIPYLWVVRGAFDPLCYVGKVVGFKSEEEYGDGDRIVLSNMFMEGKEPRPGSVYPVSVDCIKEIRLLE